MTSIEWRPSGANAQRTLVVGRSGTGKTTRARGLAALAPRAVWLDPKGLNEAGWPHIVQADLFADIGTAGGRAAALRDLLDQHGRIVVQLADRPDLGKTPKASDAAQVDAVAHAAYTLGNVLVAIDDLQGVMESAPTYYVMRVLTMGRSRGVGSLGMVTSVYRLPLDFVRQTNHILAFAQHMAEDVDRLRAIHPDLAQASDLEPYEYAWADLDTGTVRVFGPLAAN
ncbi:MAG: hypothetical protein M0R73_02660 [Dehalococcoidia bacterium]|nr:hypothetical protein [Dehalococcoidia bacterium]